MNKDIYQLITDSLTGRITNEEQAELERWLNSSPENAKRYKALTDENELGRQYRLYTKVNEKRAWRRFKEHNLKPWHRHKTVRPALYAAAAVALICFVMTAGGYVLSGDVALDKEVKAAISRSEKAEKQKALLTNPDGRQTVLSSFTNMKKGSIVSKLLRNITNTDNGKRNTLSTYPNTEYWITLEDGTLVHLNNGTKLSYPEHFDDNSRVVQLEGEAYFQVAHDKERPFRIITQNGEITDLGTAFNVNTRADQGTEVVLVEGKVEIKTNSNTKATLNPGELAYMAKQKADIEVAKVDVSPFVSWNKGNFKFKNCPLEKLMEVISHWYGIKVKYGSNDIRHIHFTGDIDRYESAQPVLKAIEVATSGLKVEQDGDVFIMKHK